MTEATEFDRPGHRSLYPRCTNLCTIFIPDFPCASWFARGITTLQHLMIGSFLCPYSYLTNRYQLPNSDYYRYLQIKYSLATILNIWPNIPSDLWEFYTTLSRYKKGISTLYTYLQHRTTPTQLTTFTAWELELQISPSLKQWKLACQSVHLATKNVDLWELYLKSYYVGT